MGACDIIVTSRRRMVPTSEDSRPHHDSGRASMTAIRRGSAVCPIVVGRQADLAALYDLMAQAVSGQGRVALISGDAGIGKSRLVAEARTYATAKGMEIFQGSCFSTDQAAPYAPLLDLFRAHFLAPAVPPLDDEAQPLLAELWRLVPELALRLPQAAGASLVPSDDPDQARQRLFAIMTHYFVAHAARRPILLIIEDAHWCDDLSLDFLLRLARRSQQAPMLVLVTYRTDELYPPLRRWLAQVDRERLAHEIALEPLAEAEVATMLGAILGLESRASGAAEMAPALDDELGAALYARSEGNPFFVEELLKALVTAGDVSLSDGAWRYTAQRDAVPRSVREAVQQRAAYLSAEARRVLTLAAIAGRRFDITLLQTLMGCDETQLLASLKELIAAQLVTEEAVDQFAFRHALTQQAIAAELLARERQHIHRRIAETLERLATSSPLRDRYLEDLARHCFAAEMWEQTLTYSQEAGERALALYAQRAAIGHLTNALEAASRLSQPPAARLYLLRGQAYDTLGDFERARGDYTRALEAAHTAHDSAMEWEGLLALGFLWSARDYEQAGAWFQQAITLADQLGDPTLRARSLNRMGNWLVNTGRAEEGIEAHKQALTIFETHTHTRGMAETLDLLGTAYGLWGDKISSVHYQSQAVTLFRQLGDDIALVWALAGRAFQMALETNETIYQPSATVADCRADADEAFRLAQQIGSLSGQAFATFALSYASLVAGDVGLGLRHAQESLHIAATIEHRQWQTIAAYGLGATYLFLLQPTLARSALETGLTLAHELGSDYFVLTLAAQLALAHIQARALPQAEATLATVAPFEREVRDLARRQLAWAWGELALAQGDAECALQRADDLLASVPGDPQPQPIPYLLHLRGEALVALVRYDEAEQALTEAARGAEARHDLFILWRIHAALARLHHRLKRKEHAHHDANAARQIIGSLAATIEDGPMREHFLRSALATLPQRLSLTSQTSASVVVGGLSAREREVAALVAQGHANREIATRLVVSERTAEAHVSNILGKLGLTSRAQIVAWAIEHHLTANE